MAIRSPLPQISYSSRDWDSIREAIFDFLKKKFPDDWTDFSESNLGNALVEIVAYAFEVLSFSLDRAVNENFITTAQERNSIINLAALLGYKLSAATAASADVIIHANELEKLQSPIFISSGTRVSAGDVEFEVADDYTIVRIDGGSTSVTTWSVNGGETREIASISIIQGSTATETYTSDGSKFQVFTSTRRPYIDKSAYVTVDGVAWLAVSSLVLGDLDDPDNQNIYEIITDKDDRLSIRFGDGVTGSIPAEGAVIQVAQRIGGGERGNIAAGSLTGAIPCTSNGQPATVKGNNQVGSGGTDRESIEHARLYAPLWGRTTDRAITYEDYVAFCNGFSDGTNGRIAKAGVIADPTDGIANVVTIYTWAEDAAGNLVAPSNALKSALREYLNNRKVITVYISPIMNGVNVPVDLDLLVSLYPGFNQEEIKKQISSVLQLLFSSDQVRYDNQLRISWIHDYLIAIPGVKSINVRSPNPASVTGTTIHIEEGTLPSQVGVSAGQAIITSADTVAANHYVNYEIVFGGNSVIRRVIASSATVGAAACTLTLDEPVTSAVVTGVTYYIRHPRRVRIDGVTFTNEDQVINRRLVIRQPAGGIDDVERSIVSYDVATNVAFVDRDYNTYPGTAKTAIITPDFFVSQTRSLTLGNVDVEIEDSY